jgi:hypothetical protein
MNVTYSDKAKQSGEGFSLLQQATSRLEEILGRSAGLVEAAWDRTEDDKGHPLYTLRISAWTDSAAASFTPEELVAPRDVRLRLRFLWDDLLRARNHKQLEKLQAMDSSED